MKKQHILKGKMCLLLITAILILCAGFLIVGCGVAPATKAENNNVGNFALDFTDCPSGTCLVAFSSAFPQDAYFEGKPLTFEAWVKPTATSTGDFLYRFSARGAKLHASSTATALQPRFTIKRVVASPSGPGGQVLQLIRFPLR